MPRGRSVPGRAKGERPFPLHRKPASPSRAQPTAAKDQFWRRNQELTVLNAVASAVSRHLKLKTVLSVTLKKTLSLMRVGAGIIYLCDTDRRILSPVAHRGISKAHLYAIRSVRLGEGLSGVVAASRRVLMISDVLRDPRTFGSPDALRGLRAYVGVPIHCGRKVLGVFVLLDRQLGRFTKEDGALLGRIANQVGMAIENARLYEEVRHELAARKQTEAALQESEERFREIFEHAAVGIAQVTFQGRILHSNPALQEMLGYTGEELQGKSFPKFSHPADAKGVPNLIRAALAGNHSNVHLEKRYLHKDGRIVWANVHCCIYRDAGGKPRFVIAVIENITEHKRTEEALQQEHDRARQYLDIAGVMLLVVAADQSVAMINRKGQQVLGCSAGEIVGRNWFDTFVPARDRDRARDSFFQLMAGKIKPVENFENPIVTKAGKERTIAWHNSLLSDESGNIIGVLASGEDITDQRSTEKTLSALAKFQNEMLDSAAIWVSMIDARGNVTFWNRAAERVSGYSREEVIGHSLAWKWLFPNPAQRAESLSRIRDLVRQGERVENIEMPIRCKDGQSKIILWHASNLVNERGKLVGGVILGRDISGRKRAEKALRESEERFRTLFREAPIGVATADAHFRFLDANDVFCRMLGYSKDELLRKMVLDVTYPDDKPVFLKTKADALAGVSSGFCTERRFVRKDGSFLFGRITTQIIRDPEGKFLYGIGMLEDISVRKRAEEQLKTYQERLRSLASQLALAEERERRRIATVLHDEVGQALALARIKLGELADASPRKEFTARIQAIYEMIEQVLNRARSLTFELSPPVLYELGLGDALDWLLEEFREQYPARWEFKGKRLSPPLEDDVRVTLFQGARELLFNIVKHARARTVSVRVECGPAEVRIRVEDAGVGFAAHEFWSNPRAMTGFGLFSVRERLESLGGRLDTDSWPGGGARMTLAAPLASSGVPSKGG